MTRDIEWVLRHAEEALVELNRLEHEVAALRRYLDAVRGDNFVLSARLSRAERPFWRKLLRLN